METIKDSVSMFKIIRDNIDGFANETEIMLSRKG